MFLAHSTWLALLLVPAAAAAQSADTARSDWTFLTRATISGNSHESTPEGYDVYSGLTLEAAVARTLTDVFAVELSLRAESREVTGPESLTEHRLGSLEVLPASLTLKWQPRGGTEEVFQPFAGGGLTMTFVWEKTGPLDSTDPPISFDPVVQLGSHLRLSRTFLLTLDVKWQPLEIEIDGFAEPAPVVQIDPLVIGAGFGFAF